MSLTETLSRMSNTFVTEIGAAVTPPVPAHNATAVAAVARSARRCDGERVVGRIPVSGAGLMRGLHSGQGRDRMREDERAQPRLSERARGCQGFGRRGRGRRARWRVGGRSKAGNERITP